jgi:hypothetical protein
MTFLDIPEMLVEKSFHRLYSVPSGTLCEMEKIHI